MTEGEILAEVRRLLEIKKEEEFELARPGEVEPLRVAEGGE